MNKNKTAETELVDTVDGLKKQYGALGTGQGFKVGHPRVGGRKKGSLNKRTRQAIEICEAMDFHPAAFLATIALTGQMPNPDGTTTPVDTEARLRAVTALAPFVMPKLQATQVTGKDDGPIETATLDITRLLENPDTARAAQQIGLALAQQEALSAGLPEPKALLPAPVEIGPDGYVKK